MKVSAHITTDMLDRLSYMQQSGQIQELVNHLETFQSFLLSRECEPIQSNSHLIENNQRFIQGVKVFIAQKGGQP
ncbi:MAG: hypothetical protein RSH25_17070 [Bacteroides sp.]|uniref:hypothetical protein n=1 Tax=Bacteroides sp. TaxID=29523 RepID=UPI002FC7F04D